MRKYIDNLTKNLIGQNKEKLERYLEACVSFGTLKTQFESGKILKTFHLTILESVSKMNPKTLGMIMAELEKEDIQGLEEELEKRFFKLAFNNDGRNLLREMVTLLLARIVVNKFRERFYANSIKAQSGCSLPN